jgi:hypothetical protein
MSADDFIAVGIGQQKRNHIFAVPLQRFPLHAAACRNQGNGQTLGAEKLVHNLWLFFGIVQRIASVLTRNDKSGSDLMEFIREAIDKIINKDEKEKVIELLLQYAMLLSENSVLKLRYNAQQDEPGLVNNHGNNLRRARGMGRASLNLGGESIPLKLEVTID